MIISHVRQNAFTRSPSLKDARVHDISLSPAGRPKKEQEIITPLAGVSGTATDDYVWDIFYRRPGATDEWAGKINIATLYVPVGQFLLAFWNMLLLGRVFHRTKLGSAIQIQIQN